MPQNQVMSQAKIVVPADSMPILINLITHLGGHIETGIDLDSNPWPALDRGGKMLRGLRQRAGLTQKEVADTLGLPQSHISEFEKDKRNIPYKHAQKLARLLHSLPSHFMKPNVATLESIRELGEGKGKRNKSAGDLFTDLGI